MTNDSLCSQPLIEVQCDYVVILARVAYRQGIDPVYFSTVCYHFYLVYLVTDELHTVSKEVRKRKEECAGKIVTTL